MEDKDFDKKESLLEKNQLNNEIIENEDLIVLDENQEDFETQNIDDEGKLLLNKYIYENDRKEAIRKVLKSAFIYFLALNLFTMIFHPFLYLINNEGFEMIFLVSISMICIYYYIGKENLDGIRFKGNKKLGIKQFIFFIGLNFIFSFISSIIVYLFVNILGIKSVDVTGDITKSMNILMFIYAIIFGPIMEEIQYRGFYLNHIKKYGKYMTLVLTSIIFSFSHMNFIQGIGTLGVAFILGYIAMHYGFKYAVLLHIFNNIFAFGAGYLELNNYLNGESFLEVILVVFVIILMLNTIINLFRKKVRYEFKETMPFTLEEKDSLRYLFKDRLFYVYLIFMIFIMLIPTLIFLSLI